jgi:hypothetical protein
VTGVPGQVGVRRFIAAAFGTALLCAAAWLALRNLSVSTHDGWIFWVPIALWLTAMSILWYWSAIVGHVPAEQERISATWRAGWIVGGIALALGFVGPLVIYPGANLGPLLGILLTGPLGFIVGVVGAVVLRRARDR